VATVVWMIGAAVSLFPLTSWSSWPDTFHRKPVFRGAGWPVHPDRRPLFKISVLYSFLSVLNRL